MPFLLIVAMFLTPLVCGIVLGGVQVGIYRLLRRPAEAVPSFPILFARGLLAFFLVAAALALATRLG